MMIDPREANGEECLTEDSDDALADLEKEFAIKKQQLLEERARKKQRQVDVERSPSPERKPQVEYFQKTKPEKPEREQPKVVSKPQTLFTTQPKSSFASRLQEPKKASIDLSERIFEFEDVPDYKTIEVAAGDKDRNTGLELLSRRIESAQLEQLLRGIKVLSVRKLLAKVVAPHFEEPRYVNWCFAGMVIFKSPPRHTVNGQKYLQLRVGDFEHSVDVMLFGPAFNRFWKLSPAEVIYILNPKIKRVKGAPLVSVGEDLMCIVEAGRSRHFGYCEGATKAGLCKHVVDVSRSRLCTYHEEKKYRGLRMELQGVAGRRPGEQKSGNSQKTKNRFPNDGPFFLYGNQQCVQSERDQVFFGGSGFDEAQYDGAPVTATKRKGPEEYEQIQERLKRQEAKKQKIKEHTQKSLLKHLSHLAPARVSALQKLRILPGDHTQGDLINKGNVIHGNPKGTRKAHSELVSSGDIIQEGLKIGKNLHKTASGIAAAANPEGNQLHSSCDTKTRMQELMHLSRQKKVSLRPERIVKSRKPHDELEIEFVSDAQKSAYQRLQKHGA